MMLFAPRANGLLRTRGKPKTIAQKTGKYSDELRDQFIALKRQYRYFPVNDERFLSELQRAGDWLTARKVLPEPIKVTDHLAQL
jgi:sulfonate transport system substrate-binding protein